MSSPHDTTTFRTALPPVAGVITNVKVAGTPTLGAGDGSVMMIVGAVAMATVTDPDACPAAVVPELVPPEPVPVAGAVAPTLAVTIAC